MSLFLFNGLKILIPQVYSPALQVTVSRNNSLPLKEAPLINYTRIEVHRYVTRFSGPGITSRILWTSIIREMLAKYNLQVSCHIPIEVSLPSWSVSTYRQGS